MFLSGIHHDFDQYPPLMLDSPIGVLFGVCIIVGNRFFRFTSRLLTTLCLDLLSRQLKSSNNLSSPAMTDLLASSVDRIKYNFGDTNSVINFRFAVLMVILLDCIKASS